MYRVVVIQQRVVIESCLLTARASLYLCDVCYAELNELGLVWGAFSFRPHNEPYASHWFPFLLHSLFLTQSHTPLHYTIYANSITNTLYHSHKLSGVYYSENGEVTSNAIPNRGKSIDRFSLLFFTLFLHPHTLFRYLLLPFSISFLPLSHSILIFAKAMISQCNPSSVHSIYSMLCERVHSIQYHSLFLHPNSLPIPTLSFYPWNEYGI